MKLARAVHLDESDEQVFVTPAKADEWLVSGGFEFSNWGAAELEGKARQAFNNGWLAIGSFGRATLASIAEISEPEFADLTEILAQHFVDKYGAPDLDAARQVAMGELQFMADLCADHPDRTLLSVQRELTAEGVKEGFRSV